MRQNLTFPMTQNQSHVKSNSMNHFLETHRKVLILFLMALLVGPFLWVLYPFWITLILGLRTCARMAGKKAKRTFCISADSSTSWGNPAFRFSVCIDLNQRIPDTRRPNP